MRRPSAAVLLLVSSASAETPRAPSPDLPPWVEMQVEGVYQVRQGASSVVLLRAKAKGDGRLLPIWIGETEALAISLRLARQRAPRPLTHDLFERTLDAVGAKLVKVHVEDLRDSTFLGRLFLAQGDRRLDVDARPSDSIALALGAGVPIFAARKVLDRAGIDPKMLTDEDGEPGPDLEELLREGEKAGKGSSI